MYIYYWFFLVSEGWTMTSGHQNTLEIVPTWKESLEEVTNTHFLSGEKP